MSPSGSGGGPGRVTGRAAAFLALRSVTKSFGESRVLEGVDLEVRRGEVMALLGRSGSGKSTLLRIVAGFEHADRGSLTLEGRDFSGEHARRRGFGMVFQSYALFPHLSVADNVAFGLRHLDRASRERRVGEMLELVQLDSLGGRGVDQISGGQQQRVALARALAPSPKLLLLDEPLSNLDPSLREQTREQLRWIVASVDVTTLLVTHEQEEAFDLGDRVAVLERGAIEQVGTPEELYTEPTTEFVAEFVGRSNRTAGIARPSGEGTWAVACAGWSADLKVPRSQVIGAAPARGGDGIGVRLWMRPEHLRVGRWEDSTPCWSGAVIRCRRVGPHVLVTLENDEGERLEVAHGRTLEPGETVTVVLVEPAAVRLLPES